MVPGVRQRHLRNDEHVEPGDNGPLTPPPPPGGSAERAARWATRQRAEPPFDFDRPRELRFTPSVAYRRTPAVQHRLNANRERIVNAAIDLVARDGYNGCSIAAVASRADIGTGTLYRHFANKGELFTEVFRIVTNREVAALESARDQARAATGSGVAAVAAAVGSFAQRVLSAPTLAYALLAEPVDPQVDTERLFFRRTFRDALAVAIDDAIAATEIPPQDTAVTAACMVGAIAEALVVPLSRGTADPTVVPAIVRVVVRSLGRLDIDDFSLPLPATWQGP